MYTLRTQYESFNTAALEYYTRASLTNAWRLISRELHCRINTDQTFSQLASSIAIDHTPKNL